MHAQSDNRLIFSSERRWQFPGFVKRAITRWHNKKKLTLHTSQYQEISYPITDYIVLLFLQIGKVLFLTIFSSQFHQYFIPTAQFVNKLSYFSDGFKFYRSANNVILCPGNEDGFLPPCYFQRVMQTRPSKHFQNFFVC